MQRQREKKREGGGRERAREIFANTQRFKSSANVLTMTKTSHLRDFREILSIVRKEKKCQGACLCIRQHL